MVVHGRMQRGYRDVLTVREGRDFATEFRPKLTPTEMLELGMLRGKSITECRAEFPAEWSAHARLFPACHALSLDFFAVYASRPLSIRHEKG